MTINWNLLSNANPAAALQAGFEHGQEQRRTRDARGALSALAANPNDTAALGVLRAANPELSFKMEDRLREQRTRATLGRVFGGGGAAPQTSAFQGYGAGGGGGALSAFNRPSVPAASAPSFASPPPSMIETPRIADAPALAAAAPSAAPEMLVDPSSLAPRTDGMRINQAALRELYADDYETAIKVQKAVYDADAAGFKRMQQSGDVLARAAMHLDTFKNPDGSDDIPARQRELQTMMPQLVALGLDPESIKRADVSSRGLSRYRIMGQSMKDLVSEDQAERRLNADIADDEADNYRADRNTDDIIADRAGRRGLVARGQDLADARGRYGIGVASADRRRGQDISSTDRQRGQDVSSTDRRRGQDMADTRIRETGGGKGTARVRPGTRPPQVPGTAANPAVVTSREQAMLLPKGTVFKTPDGTVKVR